MNKRIACLLAAAIASVLLSALLWLKAYWQILPQLNIISVIAAHLEIADGAAWWLHGVVATLLYSVLFYWLNAHSADNNYVLRGIVVGLLGWLVIMLFIMPALGFGLFIADISQGSLPAVATLIVHLCYGACLGTCYGYFIGWRPAPE